MSIKERKTIIITTCRTILLHTTRYATCFAPLISFKKSIVCTLLPNTQAHTDSIRSERAPPNCCFIFFAHFHIPERRRCPARALAQRFCVGYSMHWHIPHFEYNYRLAETDWLHNPNNVKYKIALFLSDDEHMLAGQPLIFLLLLLQIERFPTHVHIKRWPLSNTFGRCRTLISHSICGVMDFFVGTESKPFLFTFKFVACNRKIFE